MKNNEGLPAILFASYLGNITIIKLLESLNANIRATNHGGLNVLHIAS